MKIGFIGAGNVGCSLGRYLNHKNIPVAGYYSRTKASADEAAKITNTRRFDTLKEIIDTCDTLFLTVPDGKIKEVWSEVKSFPIEGKTICHCSGAMSANIFSDIRKLGAYGYSIHPMFPFNSKTISYDVMQEIFITVEGNQERIDEMTEMFHNLGNPVKVITSENKTSYHAASVMASNEVVALLETAVRLLKKCQFKEEEALHALKPLALYNMEHIFEVGTTKALTGPVERNDVGTVQKHLEVLDEEEKRIYLACSAMLLHITKRKYPEREEDELRKLLEE